VAATLLVSLAGCGGVDEDDVAISIEKAWDKDHLAMASQAGLELPGQEPGGVRGLSETANTANSLIAEYGGDLAGEIAKDTIETTSKLAAEYGIEGAEEFRDSLGLTNAKDWQVQSLEILSGRESGEAYVAIVRYDLSVDIDGKQVRLGQDISHKVRMINGPDGWEIETTK
jgi:hypothetical protein